MTVSNALFWFPMIPFHAVKFLKSAAQLSQCPPDEGIEVAFVGRSNAGKSSAINALLNQRVARTSKTPGQTQLINIFTLDDHRRMIDLPGYGYAKVPDRIKIQIERILHDYIGHRACLRGVFLMMDIRHPLTLVDDQLLELANDYGLKVHILLTKSDKINRGQAQNVLLKVRKGLAAYPNVTVQTFSALRFVGIEEALQKLESWFTGDDLHIPA